VTTPSSSSACIALRTVMRDTPVNWLRSRSPGRIFPCSSTPLRTAFFTVSANFRYSGVLSAAEIRSFS
jgi:hypothetical protein